MQKNIIILLLCLWGAMPVEGQCWEEFLNVTPFLGEDNYTPNLPNAVFRTPRTVYAVNDSIIWVGSDHNILCVTHDGGVTWQTGLSPYSPLPNGRPRMDALWFFDGERGFIGTGDGSLLPMMKTSDGGQSWSPVQVQLPGVGQVVAERVSGIRFVSPTEAWAVSMGKSTNNGNGPQRPGYIMKTEDGGETWRAVAFLQLGWEFMEAHPIIYATADTLYAYGLTPYGISDRFFLFKLVGQDIEIVYNDNDNSYGPFFQTGSTGWWGVTDDYHIKRTDDGGQTWQPVPLTTPESVEGLTRLRARAPVFANDSLGWAALGFGGALTSDTTYMDHRIYVTTDGGSTWKRQHAEIFFPLYRFSFSDSLAFLNTSPGRIYRYRGRPAPCGPLAVSATGSSLSPLLSWPRAEGCYDGYYLQLGSSPGGADLLPRTDVGLDTFYQVAATLPEGTEVFATVLPYNHVYGAAEGCPGSSFTTPVCGGPVAVDTAYCAGGALLWGDSLIAAPGTYTFSGLAVNGCDTTTVLHVTELPALVGTLDTAYCVGSALEWEGSLISEPGTYEFHYSTASGCDSLLRLQVTELPPLVGTLDTTYCAGEAFYWEGELLIFPGTYEYAYPLPSGCDSTLLLNLERLPNRYTRIDTVLAPGGLYEGQPYSGDTLLSFVLPAANGCDSLVEVYLSVVTGSREVAAGPMSLQLYPNPTTSTLYLKAKLPSPAPALLTVQDAMGRELLRQPLPAGSGQHELDVSAWPAGVYFLRLRQGEVEVVERFVKGE